MYDHQKIWSHRDQNLDISQLRIKILFSISYFNFKWFINPVKLGTLFCFTRVNIWWYICHYNKQFTYYLFTYLLTYMYCFVYSINKFTILFSLNKGVSPKVLFGHKANYLSRFSINKHTKIIPQGHAWLYHKKYMLYCFRMVFTEWTFIWSHYIDFLKN